MTPRALTGEFSVADQVTPEDFDYLVDAGFKTVICNRPDGEAEDQPEAEDLAAAAAEHGVRFVNIPVIAGALNEDDVEAFVDALDREPKPILAFCRTGHRSAVLWAVAMANEMDVDDIMAAATDAEVDLSAFRPHLEAAAARKAWV
ncbi:MAG: TIGR01244 family sulfur transferase [Pseudomonadota bacterium]